MHISWSFLDKRKAAINAMEAFDSMDFIVKHSDEEIQRVENRMVGVGSQNLDGMPHAHNPQAAEDRILTGIEEIDTKYGTVRKKISSGYGVSREKFEYNDIAAIASAENRSVKEITKELGGN